MIRITQETPEEASERLRHVLRLSRVEVMQGSYAFLEYPAENGVIAARADAIAVVRDDTVWSQLVPCNDPNEDCLAMFRIHFPNGVDNSGFIGWLAGHLKRRFGTGVFVVCGHNRKDGGIFDYWGIPLEIAPAVWGELAMLAGTN